MRKIPLDLVRTRGSDPADDEVADLPGVGPTMTGWLHHIGIRAIPDLAALGSVETFLRLRRSRAGVSFNALWVLEALELGCRWQDVPAERKMELREIVAKAEAQL